MSSIFTENNLYNRVMTKIFDLCLLNLLTFLCCIPIVTAGASLSAMYAVMMKMAKNQEGAIIKSFIKELKANLKGSIGGWLLILAVFLLLLLDLPLWSRMQTEYGGIFYGLTLAMLAALSAYADWYFALRAKFEETSKTALKNAGKFWMVYLPVSALMGCYTLGIAVVLIKYPVLIVFVPLAGLVLLGYPKALYIRGRFERYIEIHEVKQNVENNAEAAKDTEEAEHTQEDKTGIPEDDLEIQGETENKEQTVKKKDMAEGEAFGLKERFMLWRKIEAEKMERMTRQERKSYLFTYYRSWIITLVLLLVIILGISYHYLFNNADLEFQCVVVNGYTDKGDMALSDKLNDYFQFEPRQEYAYFDTQYQIAYPGVDNETADTSFYEKFFLNIRAGVLDVAIVPESFMEYCNTIEKSFYDVTEVLDAEQIKAYQPYFVTDRDDTGKEYICGINISNMAFLEKETIGFVKANRDEAFILTFPCNGTHMENCRAFMKFIEEYEK